MSSTSPSRHVLLIESLPSESRTPRNVFELDSSQLRPLIKHLPDGEQNDRGGWFWTQIDPMQHSPFLEADSERLGPRDGRRRRLPRCLMTRTASDRSCSTIIRAVTKPIDTRLHLVSRANAAWDDAPPVPPSSCCRCTGKSRHRFESLVVHSWLFPRKSLSNT